MATKKSKSAAAAKPAEAATNGEAKLNRYTRSFTPVRDYDTVALVGVQMHSSIKVDEKLATDLQNAIRDAALGIVKRMVPAAVKLATKDSSAWARITGDTEASVKVVKERASKNGASKTVERIFEDNALADQFKAASRKHAASLPQVNGKPDYVGAMKLAIGELKLNREQVTKLTSAQMATQLMGAAPQPATSAKK